MIQKVSVILTLFLVAFSIQAQEGNPIIPEEREERHLLPENSADSAQFEKNLNVPQPSSEENGIISSGSSLKLNSAFLPNEDSDGQVEAKEDAKKLSYNFLYYLFYKFRKVDKADE